MSKLDEFILNPKILRDKAEKLNVVNTQIVDQYQNLQPFFNMDEMNYATIKEIVEDSHSVKRVKSMVNKLDLRKHKTNASVVATNLKLYFEKITELKNELPKETVSNKNDDVRKKVDVLEEELRNEMVLRKLEETELLAQYYNDNKYSITKDSLIIVDINKGNGKYAKAGSIMKVYFTFQTHAGDTLLDFTSGKPYELVYGDMALGQGFYEALGLVSKGGDGEFVIPSSTGINVPTAVIQTQPTKPETTTAPSSISLRSFTKRRIAVTVISGSRIFS